MSKGREKLHKVIFKLHKQSLGYKKIHKRLVEKGFKIGKSPSTVDSIIKKRIKREEFLNRPVFEEYRNFDIEFYKIKKEMKNNIIFGVQDVKKGRIVYLADNPLFRAFWYNGKLLFGNAVFIVGG